MLNSKDICSHRVFSQTFLSNKVIDGIHIGESDMVSTETVFAIEENWQKGGYQESSSSNFEQLELAKHLDEHIFDFGWDFASRRRWMGVFSDTNEYHFVGRGIAVFIEGRYKKIKLDVVFVLDDFSSDSSAA
jgi:hypothetical protein